MSSIIFFLIFIPILSIILLGVNFIFAPHNPYKEKKTPFECGYHSFLSQNRTQFTISFFIFALLFLIFDLEIVLIYPYTVSSYANNIYGLIIMIVFTLIVTVGFIFELGKNALKIESKQTRYIEPKSNEKIKTFKPLQSGWISQFRKPKKNELINIFIRLFVIVLIAISQKFLISTGTSLLDQKWLYYIYCIILIVPLHVLSFGLRNEDYKFSLTQFMFSFLIFAVFGWLCFIKYNFTIFNIDPELLAAFLSGTLLDFIKSHVNTGHYTDHHMITTGTRSQVAKHFTKNSKQLTVSSLFMERGEDNSSKGKELKPNATDSVELISSRKRPRPSSWNIPVRTAPLDNPPIIIEARPSISAEQSTVMTTITEEDPLAKTYCYIPPGNPIQNPNVAEWDKDCEIYTRTVEIRLTKGLGRILDKIEQSGQEYIFIKTDNDTLTRFIHGILIQNENFKLESLQDPLSSKPHRYALNTPEVRAYLRQAYDQRVVMQLDLKNNFVVYMNDSNYVEKRWLELIYYTLLEKPQYRIYGSFSSRAALAKIQNLGWEPRLSEKSNTYVNRSVILREIDKLHGKVNWIQKPK